MERVMMTLQRRRGFIGCNSAGQMRRKKGMNCPWMNVCPTERAGVRPGWCGSVVVISFSYTDARRHNTIVHTL